MQQDLIANKDRFFIAQTKKPVVGGQLQIISFCRLT
jgi:hypothetical protein